MAFPEDIASNTPAKYQFKLVSDTETIICNPEPLDWSSGTFEMKRDLELGGVFLSYQTDSLTFIGNGAELLRKIYTNAEVNAKCTLIQYWWKNSTRAYVEFPTRFDINFNFYEIVKVGKFHFGVRVKAVSNSVQTKLDSRQDIDVDILKLTSIGSTVENNIIDYVDLKKELLFDTIGVVYSANIFKRLSNSQLFHINSTVSYTSIPLDKYSSEFSEIQTVGYVTKQINLTAIPSFFKNALYDYENLDVNYTISIVVTDRYVGSFPWNIQILETKETNGVTEIITTYDIGGFGGLNKTYDFQGTEPVKCDKGNDLKFVIQSPGINATYSAHLIFQQLIIFQTVTEIVGAKITEGFPVYEAIERVLQHILDVQYPFYSEFFGRDDVNYKEGVGYSTVLGFVESQLRFAHIQSGLNQRGLPLMSADGMTNSLTLNFKDLFKSLKAIWNVGYSLEAIGESLRVRIEQYSYFFQDVEVLDLSSRINKYDIQSQVMPELVPNDLKSGFQSYEYLSANGRAEPNTVSQRTSIMNTATKFENISELRGDTKGILDNLSNPIEENETVDTKGDDDVFIIKTQRGTTSDWKAEKAENIAIENETSLFKESLLNRYFTPSRMLIRHGNRIKSGMMKYLTSVLRFQKSDKSSSLETSGDGIDNLKESDDIIVSTLAAPLFKPMKHTVEVEFSKADLETLQANPLGYLTYSDSVSGYLLNLKMKNGGGKADISIIERYV